MSDLPWWQAAIFFAVAGGVAYLVCTRIYFWTQRRRQDRGRTKGWYDD